MPGITENNESGVQNHPVAATNSSNLGDEAISPITGPKVEEEKDDDFFRSLIIIQRYILGCSKNRGSTGGHTHVAQKKIFGLFFGRVSHTNWFGSTSCLARKKVLS
jgi:hypothetical protein